MTEKDVFAAFSAIMQNEGVVFWRSPSFKKMRWDIFGVFDVVCLQGGKIFFVQLTTLSNLAARRKKIRAWRFANGLDNPYFPFAYVYALDVNRGVFKIEQV